MPISNLFHEDSLQPDLNKFRWIAIIGGVLIALFMITDLAILPPSLHLAYLVDRLGLQLPAICILLAFSFHPRFHLFYQVSVVTSVLWLTYANYLFIYLCWSRAHFSFPYEGTLLYAFFGFFVLGIRFRWAVIHCIVASLGFALLVFLFPVYGDRDQVNLGFVVASLFIGTIGIYRLDNLFDRIGQVNDQLHEMSRTDPLTDLFNRRALIDESEQLLKLCRRAAKPLAVFMVDIDHFKEFNDEYGHQAGDQAIIAQARILKEVFKRETDVLGRYGGEEFLVVTSDTSDTDCDERARQILDHWRTRAIRHIQTENEGLLSCSIGICHAVPDASSTLDDMIRCADEALYQAKHEGRARFVRSSEWTPGSRLVSG